MQTPFPPLRMVELLRRFAFLCRLLAVAAAATMAGGGCGAATDAVVETERVAAFETFTAALSRAMCGWQFRCCTLPEIDLLGGSRYLNEEECRAAMPAMVTDRLWAFALAAREGRLTLASDMTAACVADFVSGACAPAEGGHADASLLWQRLDRCSSPIVGVLPAGAACSLPGDCAPGTTCRTGQGSAVTGRLTRGGVRAPRQIGDEVPGEVGRCEPDRKEADSCLSTRECAVGLYCRGTDFVCAHPAAEGEACIQPLDNEGAPVLTTVACGDVPSPLLCLAGSCRRYPQEGEPCLPATFKMPVCDPNAEVELSCAGQDANASGICKKTAPIGDVCSGSRQLPACARGLACVLSDDGLLGACDQAPTAGQPCAADGSCAASAVCYGGRLTCVSPPPVRDGSPCASDLDCASMRCLPDVGAPGGVGPGICAPVASSPVCGGPGSFVVPRGNPPETERS